MRFHGTPLALLEAQAAAAGVALDALPARWEEMDGVLRGWLGRLRAARYSGVVLGDIHLGDVRAWYEERVLAAGLAHVEPLWGEPPRRLLAELVASGHRAVVTCVETSRLPAGWLGREVDAEFAADVTGAGADPCGERGEYHTFLYAGPVFARPVSWRPGRRRRVGTMVQLELESA